MPHGSSVPLNNMLIAGGGTNDDPSVGGAFSFNVNVLPMLADWYIGSAK